MKKQMLTTTVAILFGLNTLAMPEQQLGSRSNGKILEILEQNGFDHTRSQMVLKHSGIAELDALWASRVDYKSCEGDSAKCRMISRFPGTPNGQPVVVLPGYTGYRKMFLEYIYDLGQKGFGPIYISDFVGTGDTYKSYLDKNEKLPIMSERLTEKKYKKGKEAFYDRLEEVAPENTLASAIEGAVLPLNVGMGWIKDFDDYQTDLNLVMNLAVKENSQKLVVTSLSMSGLVLMMGLHRQGKNPTWIKNVSRIVIESPMLRLHATDGALAGLITQIGAAAASLMFGSKTLVAADKAFPEFLDKALGTFNKDNVITHSPNRLALIDSLRVWNNAETAGSTYGWIGQELKNQYSVKATDPKFNNLNSKMEKIAKALKDNNVTMIAAVSNDDPLTDSDATKKFMRELSKKGVKGAYLCHLDKAKHQINAESDFYRQAFMDMLFDQAGASARVLPTYGGKPAQSQLLTCIPAGL